MARVPVSSGVAEITTREITCMTDRELKTGGAPGRGARACVRGVIAALIMLGCGVTAMPAAAAQPPHPVYLSNQITIPNDGATLVSPEGLAINLANHTLLVADPGSASVLVYAPSIVPGTGTVMTQEPSVGVGTLVSPYGVAVDQALHRLYVSDSGTNTIKRYTFTTGDPATFTPAPASARSATSTRCSPSTP
jgi:DNA-binding beta-propeller fold protein YncE